MFLTGFPSEQQPKNSDNVHIIPQNIDSQVHYHIFNKI